MRDPAEPCTGALRAAGDWFRATGAGGQNFSREVLSALELGGIHRSMSSPPQSSRPYGRLIAAASRVPDLRFGQLVVNAVSARVGGDADALRRVLFYLTDDQLAEVVEDFVFRLHKPSGEMRAVRPEGEGS